MTVDTLNPSLFPLHLTDPYRSLCLPSLFFILVLLVHQLIASQKGLSPSPTLPGSLNLKHPTPFLHPAMQLQGIKLRGLSCLISSPVYTGFEGKTDETKQT